jgi:transaldolase
MFKERGYQAVMLGGGARGLHHFTEMVGGDLCVTLNWGTVASLIEKDPSVVSRINVDPSPGELEVLISKLPGFDRALRQDLMSVPDFKDFGPLVLFRTMFLNGYARLVDEIANHRVRRRGASAR